MLACIQTLATQYDRPASPVTLLAGLALAENGDLPFHQVESAVERVGFRSHTMTLPLRRFDRRRLPAILDLGARGAAVLFEVKEGQGRVFDPARGGEAWIRLESLEPDYAGRAVVVEADPARERGQGGDVFRRARDHWFWSELYKARGSFGFVALGAVLVNLLGFAMPLFTMNVYDRIIPNKAEASLWVLAIGVVFAFGFEFLLRYARAQLVDEVGRDIDARVQQRLFEKVVNTPLAARSGATGALARRIGEFESVRDFFGSTTIVLVVDMVFVFLFLGLIVALGGWLVLVPLVGVGIMIAAGFSLQRSMTAALKDAQADASLQHSTLVETIGGLETIKAVRGEGRMLGRWRRYADMSARTQENLRRLSAVAVNLAGLCQQAISIGLVVGGFYMFSAGKISMGAIVAIVMVSGRALAPVGQLAFLMTRARQAFMTLDSLDRVMASPDERLENVRSVTPTIERGAVEMRGLRFRYPEASADTLSEVTLAIRPGERIGVIGRVGSGKSTLGRVLCGLYAPTDGALVIDGLDSGQHHPHEIRKAFRYVGQEAELFSGTVRDNLMLGAPGASDEVLLAAVANSGADLFLSREATGFDLPVGERGSRLSGGQRSFMALARALVSPGRLLFLDEPTGAMDTASEQLFIERLGKALGPDHTLIVSTHRHAMLALVDRLIVMDAGRVLADGPKEQVLSVLAQGAARQG
ncbi:MAG TPA: type I secretion system permease/ATPase [Caulobacteraceae bacterium]|nr:type I secretion system permease/ATPase [Caulobacteraceae bacterium]